jgi:soluble lytic murein transglycosylase-like protein
MIKIWNQYDHYSLMGLTGPTAEDLFTELESTGSAQAFLAALPDRAKKYGADILRASSETGVSPFLIAAIANAETAYGSSAKCKSSGPACKSDSGYYLGLMQFGKKEAQWAAEKLPNGRPQWSVPYFNFRRGAEYFVETRDLLIRLLKNSGYNWKGMDQRLLAQWIIAAYNKGAGSARKGLIAGVDPDSITDSSADFDSGAIQPYVARVVGHMNALKSRMPAGTV